MRDVRAKSTPLILFGRIVLGGLELVPAAASGNCALDRARALWCWRTGPHAVSAPFQRSDGAGMRHRFCCQIERLSVTVCSPVATGLQAPAALGDNIVCRRCKDKTFIRAVTRLAEQLRREGGGFSRIVLSWVSNPPPHTATGNRQGPTVTRWRIETSNPELYRKTTLRAAPIPWEPDCEVWKPYVRPVSRPAPVL